MPWCRWWWIGGEVVDLLVVVVVVVVDLFVVLVVLVHRIVGRRFAPMKNGTMVAVVAAFVVLGLPDGALGLAWPSMRADFDRSVGDLGWIVVALTVGRQPAAWPAGSARRGSGAAVPPPLRWVWARWPPAPWWPVTLLAAWLWGVGVVLSTPG